MQTCLFLLSSLGCSRCQVPGTPATASTSQVFALLFVPTVFCLLWCDLRERRGPACEARRTGAGPSVTSYIYCMNVKRSKLLLRKTNRKHNDTDGIASGSRPIEPFFLPGLNCSATCDRHVHDLSTEPLWNFAHAEPNQRQEALAQQQIARQKTR